MLSPVKRQTQINLDLGKLNEKLQSVSLILEDQPEKIWFDIRSDMDGPYLACRFSSMSRKYAFRVPDAEFVGETSDGTYPADFVDFQSVKGSGQGMIQFGLPCVSVRSKDDDTFKHDVGVQPYESYESPFRERGPYAFDRIAASKVSQLLLLSESMGIREEIRIRYHNKFLEVYTTDTSRTVVARIPIDAPPGLWDVVVPREMVRDLVSMAKDGLAVFDHAHERGFWASDGKFFSFFQESPVGTLDYSFDVPGIVRAIKAFRQSFKTSSVFWEVVGKSGYHLVDLTVNCAKISKIEESTLNFHAEKLLTHGCKEVSVDYRGEPTAFILDASQLVHLHGEEVKIRLTPWPCSPYVVDDQILDLVITPPVVNPGALADSIQEVPEWESRKLELREWVGDYDRMVLNAFVGGVESRTEAVNAPLYDMKSDSDCVFLVKTEHGFVHRGGIEPLVLATCMFEFAHASLYTIEQIQAFISGNYWPGINFYVYDEDHIKSWGRDPLSPYDQWVLWNTWVDPEKRQTLDNTGNLKVSDKPSKRRQVRILESSLSAPEIPVAQPAQNAPAEPINNTEEKVSPEENEEVIPELATEAPIQYLLIDANYVTWRDFYQAGLGKMQHPSTGHYTGVAFGFIRSLRHWMQLFRPARVCVVWDGGVAQWRRALVPEYKDRTKKKKDIPEDKLNSLFLQRDWLSLNLPTLGVRSLTFNNYEADDIIALLADSFAKQGRVMIVTGDYDFNHMITQNIHVYQDRQNEILQDPALAFPSLLSKVIEGDTSDRIPGVPGVGKKTLHKFISELTEAGESFSLEAIEKHAPTHSNWRIKKLVEEESKKIIERNMEMVDLRKGAAKIDPQVMVSAIQAANTPAKLDIRAFGTWAQELAFNSVLNDISGWQQDFSRLT